MGCKWLGIVVAVAVLAGTGCRGDKKRARQAADDAAAAVEAPRFDATPAPPTAPPARARAPDAGPEIEIPVMQ